MASKHGHIMKKERTEDVLTVEDIDFAGMLLPENILSGLSSKGFKKPSPIQLKAIPLGRCGFDLILEAKSGTGKTCVFSIIALEMISVERKTVQALMLVPTREIALQVADVIRSMGSGIAGLKVQSFIGGTSFEEDKKKLQTCHIAVGAPGRIRHLMEKGFMKTERIRLCVLDEADKLMEPSFTKDIKYFFSVLPENKQVIVASATMPDELDNILSHHMKTPVRVCPHGEGVAPILLGLRQVAVCVPEHPSSHQQLNLKVYALTKLLSSVPFQQCIVFSNYLTRAEGISHELERRGWPCKHTAGVLDQSERSEAFLALLESRCRVLLSTDLTARGVDAPRVDLVVNLDLPNNGATYLHRIGRAGRFGSYGLGVTLVAAGTEVCKFSQMLRSVGATAAVISHEEFPENLWNCDLKQYESVGIPISNDKAGKASETNSHVHLKEKSGCLEGPGSKVTPRSDSLVRDDTLWEENKTNGESRTRDAEAAALFDAWAAMNDDCDRVESFLELVKSCESYYGDSGETPKSKSCAWEYGFGDAFDRLLKSADLKNSARFNERLEECKVADMEGTLKKLAAGEAWPLKSPPVEETPAETTSEQQCPKVNHSASWNMQDCDVSLFGRQTKKSAEERVKKSDSKKGPCSAQMKNVTEGSQKSERRSVAANRVLQTDDESVSRGSFSESSTSSNVCGKLRHSSYHDLHSTYDSQKTLNSFHCFNQWYQHVVFNRSLIEYNEYWKYMFRK